jgi:hypothetical protein
MVDVPGWPAAFRGSAAVAAGLVTPDVLRGPRYRRLLPDTSVPRSERPPDLALRALAAYRWADGRGVLAGYAAAELLGASCGPPGAPVEIVLARTPRAHAGVRATRARLDPAEVVAVRGVRVTSAQRTAFDLARRGPLVDRVVAVDALANAHGFAPEALWDLAARHPGVRGVGGLGEVLAHADRRAGTPMETRLRLVVVQAGLPAPEVQWAVQDERARTAVWLDLAHPEHKIGIEHDGAVHTRPDAVLRTSPATRHCWTAAGGSTGTPSTTSCTAPTDRHADPQGARHPEGDLSGVPTRIDPAGVALDGSGGGELAVDDAGGEGGPLAGGEDQRRAGAGVLAVAQGDAAVGEERDLHAISLSIAVAALSPLGTVQLGTDHQSNPLIASHRASFVVASECLSTSRQIRLNAVS